MKSIKLITILSCLFATQFAYATDVNIRIKNIDVSRKGKVYVQLCQKKEYEADSCALQSIEKVSANVALLKFKNVSPGKWAVMAFHDENTNGKLDTNALGIPTEGYGFSRNAVGRFGPPTFEQAAEDVAGETQELSFRMTY